MQVNGSLFPDRACSPMARAPGPDGGMQRERERLRGEQPTHRRASACDNGPAHQRAARSCTPVTLRSGSESGLS